MTAAGLALPPGARVGELRIDRVLGEGAFGVTYRATDPQLAAVFALKEYLPEGLVRREGERLVAVDASAQVPFREGLERFLEEGRMVARLEHPNVVRVIRCFEDHGTAYLLMPYYEGEPLDRLLQRGGSLDEDEALALARPLLDAVAHVHRQGVVHQDIKPANIYITERGTPILLDFGAAGQRLRATASTRRRLGSEGYAAPEQSEPEGEIGPWTDIYGLAATLYRCVCGRVPPPAGERLAAASGGREDPLVPLERIVPPGAFGTMGPAIRRGLRLPTGERPASIEAWTSAFLPSAAADGRGEKERLPQVLLAAFLALLLAAIAWLFLFDSGREGSTAPAVAPAEPTVAPPGPSRQATALEEARWQAALGADTVFGYRLFIEDFPGSIHVEKARAHMARLDQAAWEAARAEGSRSAVEAYLEDFPGGLHEADARIRLDALDQAAEEERRLQAEQEREEREAWEAARRSRTLEAVEAFLAAWPAGAFAAEARSLRGELQQAANDHRAFEAARKMGTQEAYRAYTQAFPRGAHLAEALEAMDRLTLRPGSSFRDCADCPLMVVVPAGSFRQGSDASAPGAVRQETPRRTVAFDRPFAIGVHEITMDQWDLCLAEGGCSNRPGDNGWGRGSRPAIMVSWNDAVEFTAWLSEKTGQAYSLPSESQWEYAARAGEESEWLGGDPSTVCRYANVAAAESGLRWQHPDCADTSALATLPVGSLQPNAFGLHDVIGNVAEWTLDCMNLSYLDAPVDGSAWGRGICSSRMTRGGSWFTGTRDIRLPARFSLKNGDRNDFTGFRVVRRVEDR